MIWAVIGLFAALALFLLLQAFARADSQTISKGLRGALFILLGLGAAFLLAMVVSGRIAVLPLLLGVGYMGFKMWLAKKRGNSDGSDSFGRSNNAYSSGPRSQGPMSRSEALEILGLEEGADDSQINKAFKKLMAQIHPDKGGNDWMASKLNQARDLLLKDK